MKRLAALTIIFILLASLGTASAEIVKTFHIAKGQSYTFELPKGTIIIENAQFQYEASPSRISEICGISVPIVFRLPDGTEHHPLICENGDTDANHTYIYYLRNIKFDTWTQTVELEQNEQDPYGVFIVKQIDVITGKVVIENTWGETESLSINDEAWVYGVPKAKVKLVSINVGLFSTTAKFQATYYDPIEADIVVETYQEQQSSPTPAPTENPNETPSNPNQTFLDPTKIPAVMIVVGENAAGADVAAGAKVGIAVQKWIDESDSLVEMLPIPSTIVKAYKEAKKTFIHADAMLDTEVQDPNKIAPIVYSVGGPAANKYSAMLNNRTDLPVRFVKENGKWYLVSKYGDRWSGSYGVIEIIPAARTPEEMKEHLLNGDFKLYDVLVAGLDRKGTYAACKLLNINFMGMLKGEKPDPRLINLISLQAQLTTLFTVSPYIDQVPATAIIVDENGKIVKVIN